MRRRPGTDFRTSMDVRVEVETTERAARGREEGRSFMAFLY
jgi:hypothetical protein